MRKKKKKNILKKIFNRKTEKKVKKKVTKKKDAKVIVKKSKKIISKKIKRSMWSRRAQEYEAKISSGKIYELAEVVRD